MKGNVSMKNNILIPVIITAVIVGAASFFGGMKYAQSQQNSRQSAFGQRTGNTGINGQNRTGRAGGSGVFGDIINADNTSITVKLQDGSSKIVLLSDTTTIGKMTEGSKSDLTAGQRVSVFGTTNADGSVTAQNVQLNPLGRAPFGTGGNQPNPSTPPGK
jgi:FtsP/CotA-like multicopper oxidase with cupredoxin domain